MSARRRNDAFARSVGDLDAVWMSNEAPGVFPDIAAQLSMRVPRGKFLLAVDGRPAAFSDPHGATLRWVAEASLAVSPARSTSDSCTP
jgi:hypothetical protein